MNWYNRHIKTAMPTPRKWTEEEINKIRKLVEKGDSFRSIAKLFGVSNHSISKLNNKYKWVDLNRKRDERDNFIADLYLSPPKGKGLSLAAIAKNYGISDMAVKKALERLGLSNELRDRHEAWTPELRQRYSDLFSEKWRDPSFREYIDGLRSDPSYIQEMSEKKTQWWKDHPEVRDEYSNNQKQRYEDNPQLRVDISNMMKEQWRNYPGGFQGFLSTFPPEKRIEIQRAIAAKRGDS
jgi:transposase